MIYANSTILFALGELMINLVGFSIKAFFGLSEAPKNALRKAGKNFLASARLVDCQYWELVLVSQIYFRYLDVFISFI